MTAHTTARMDEAAATDALANAWGGAAADLAGNTAMLALVERRERRTAAVIARTDAILNGEQR